jgi:hypothetical protein
MRLLLLPTAHSLSPTHVLPLQPNSNHTITTLSHSPSQALCASSAHCPEARHRTLASPPKPQSATHDCPLRAPAQPSGQTPSLSKGASGTSRHLTSCMQQHSNRTPRQQHQGLWCMDSAGDWCRHAGGVLSLTFLPAGFAIRSSKKNTRWSLWTGRHADTQQAKLSTKSKGMFEQVWHAGTAMLLL